MHSTKAQTHNRGKAPHNLDLGTTWACVSIMPRAASGPSHPDPTKGKNPKYSLHRRLGGHQSLEKRKITILTISLLRDAVKFFNFMVVTSHSS
jgi:hypothetical protein